MKKILSLLALAGLLGTTMAYADNFNVKAASAPVTKTATKPRHQVTYITNVPVTGSHLPLVVARYGNDVRSTSSLVAYSAPQLDQAGQLNIGAELVRRDPAITAVHGGRR